MIYLDSSALVKLVIVEPETAALREWLAERAGTGRLTSAVAEVEVPRATMRAEPTALLNAYHVVARLRRIALSGQVCAVAASLRPIMLRSMDAIHLASALQLGDHLEAFVAYDERLVEAAREAGLSTVRPS